MKSRTDRTAWGTLDADGWKRQLETMLMKPMKEANPIDPREFEESTRAAGIRPHRVKRFYDPTPEGKKREVAANFRDYLEKHRDAVKRTEK